MSAACRLTLHYNFKLEVNKTSTERNANSPVPAEFLSNDSAEIFSSLNVCICSNFETSTINPKRLSKAVEVKNIFSSCGFAVKLV
jgi:hypothetical protein